MLLRRGMASCLTVPSMLFDSGPGLAGTKVASGGGTVAGPIPDTDCTSAVGQRRLARTCRPIPGNTAGRPRVPCVAAPPRPDRHRGPHGRRHSRPTHRQLRQLQELQHLGTAAIQTVAYTNLRGRELAEVPGQSTQFRVLSTALSQLACNASRCSAPRAGSQTRSSRNPARIPSSHWPGCRHRLHPNGWFP